MKTLMITGASSNTGKTTLTLGITRALKNRGLDVSPFKTGPDFIDTKYLSLAAKKPGGNLDIHMMGKEGLKEALEMNLGDYGIVEGAMGYFDGIYNSYENSSFHISEELDIPAVLVYSPRGEMFSAIPKIKGMLEFSKGRIKGIIFNKTSEKVYDMLKKQVERYLDIELLGFIPNDKSMEIEERYLGLFHGDEDWDFDKKLDYLALKVEESLEMDKLISLFKKIEIETYQFPKKRDIKIAIAYDEAFNFYYQENLNLLEHIGHCSYFSPLHDEKIPQVDLLYIGGGYPELYKEKLSKNKSMMESIKSFGRNKGYIYGEGGGLMYLTEEIEDIPMVGLIKGKTIMTKRLERFGYVDIELEEDCLLGNKGDIVKGKEYHRSKVDSEEKEIYKISKPMTDRKWKCGYREKNILGAYAHVNFLGNKESLKHMLDLLEGKGRRDDNVY